MTKTLIAPSVLAIAGLLMTAGIAHAQHGRFHGVGSGPMFATGEFSVTGTIDQPIVRLLSPRHYTICNSHMSEGSLLIHYGKKAEDFESATLEPGDCHDVEAQAIDVENPNETDTVYGMYVHHPHPMHQQPRAIG